MSELTARQIIDRLADALSLGRDYLTDEALSILAESGRDLEVLESALLASCDEEDEA